MNNVEEIVTVPGIDMVLEGAIDLSQSLGKPAQAQDPEVQHAIRRMADSCRQHAVPFCAIPRVPRQFDEWLQLGVTAFLLGDDRGVSFRALKANLMRMVAPRAPCYVEITCGLWSKEALASFAVRHGVRQKYAKS